MAENKNRRRRRGKKADAPVTTSGQQSQGQNQKNQKGKGKASQGKNAKAQAKAPAKKGGKQASKPQAGKAGKKQQGQQAGKQQKAQPKQKQQKQQQQSQAGKKKGGKPQKAQKAQRNQRNQKNANKAKKPNKQGKRKVSEEAQRQKRLQEEKHRKSLIIKSKFQSKGKKRAPSTLEASICEYLVQLGASTKVFKDDLRTLGIVAAREILIAPSKKAICVFVPFEQHAKWQKIQDRVSRELEKKYNGQDLIFVAQRKVMKLHQIKNNYPRPRNQTITSVHEQILDDIVYPTRIVGKRTRFRVGGKRVLKVYLDPKDSKDIEPKLATYEAVYRKLTKKNVKFMFPRYTI